MEKTIVAPIPGLVARVLVREGDQVETGTVVAVLNIMKTEIEVPSSGGGKVAQVLVKEWDEMQPGQPMLILDG